ncbi:MAG: hypothetical protein IJZ04_04155 [Clostridia bacterium]|nr:hypothetical protein [Clostridia bacterium]
MAKEAIKEFSGRIIGYIDTKPNGDKVVSSWTGKILGTYFKSRNVTCDFYGRIIARGECCGMLFSLDK